MLLAKQGGPLLAELTARSFDDAGFPSGERPSAHLQALVGAATTLSRASRPNQPPPRPTVASLAAVQAAVRTAAERVVADIVANACVVLNAACFAAGTKLWTPQGYRNVEDIQPGEWVYARAEHDPCGPVEVKQVEKQFEYIGRILHLHLPGGQLIRTTPEHPFFAYDKGWTAAGALHVGDEIRTDASWVRVEDLLDTGAYEKVYNLRVSDHHTYFVGDVGWGFAVWAHNAYDLYKAAIVAATGGNLHGVNEPTLRKWYDAYAASFHTPASVWTQTRLIEQLKRSLQIRGRTQLTAIINGATTDVPGPSGPFATRVRNAADSAVAAQVTSLQQVLAQLGVTDAQIGYRGSVARGTKSATKRDGTAGYPIDWDDMDVDLFIVSNQLAQIMGSRRGDLKFANSHQPIRDSMLAIELALRSAINNTPNLMPPGKMVQLSAFLVVPEDEFQRRLQPSYFFEGGQRIPQPNPARIIDANGNVTVHGG